VEEIIMQRFIEEYGGTFYDLLVIGGGISGACIAYEAASRGLSVALVEKADFGGATSAATSKMIHGGLRYLANKEFGLVRESLKERRILTNIAPNFVQPTPFITAFYKNGTPGWLVRLGMVLYDLLSFDKGWLWDKSKKMPMHKSLHREQLLALVPDANQQGLRDLNFLYSDCLSHFSERFTLAFLRSAVKYGAQIANYTQMEEYILEGRANGHKKVLGAVVRDLIHNQRHSIRAKMTISCTGPWSDLVINKILGTDNGKHLRRSEGIHVITKKLLETYVFCMSCAEGDRILIIPYRDHTLIGLTDKEYTGHPDDWHVTKDAIQELLNIVNRYYGNGKTIRFQDIKYAYGGLRPLTDVSSSDVRKASRRYEIYDLLDKGVEGVLVVEGGKWTTSRGLAENAINKICQSKEFDCKPSRSAKEYLVGSEIDNLALFTKDKQDRYQRDYSPDQIAYLVKSYGTLIDEVMEISAQRKSWQEALNPDGENLGQVVYAIRNEMALTLKDILLRRTGIGLLGYPGEEVVRKVADVAAEELNWSEARKKTEIDAVTKELKLPR
jgi:glycerol-3-phosphate dehydrogenase